MTSPANVPPNEASGIPPRDSRPFLVTLDELVGFQHSLIQAETCTLHGSLFRGTMEFRTAVGVFKLSYEYHATGKPETPSTRAYGTLTVWIDSRPDFWPAEQVFQQIAHYIQAAQERTHA